jgi:hypothetical protein
VPGPAASNLFAVVDIPEMRHHWFQLKPGGPAGECADQAWMRLRGARTTFQARLNRST